VNEEGKGRKLSANEEKRKILNDVVERVLARALQKGFFGTVFIRCQIQDGTIQDIAETVEQKYR